MNVSVLSIRLLSLLEKMPSSERDVHLLRTTIRRIEVQLADAAAKVAKPLKSLRKKAGKVRDVDVHLALLKPPLLPNTPTPNDPTTREAIAGLQDKLREILKVRHDRQLDSLRDAVTEARPLLEAKLPAIVEHADLAEPTPRDAHRQTRQARQRFLQLTRRVPEDAQELHQLRIQAKKLRYAMEPLQPFEEAVELVAKFKQVQDAIGSWHDWATLAQLAQRKLTDAAPICAVLQARTAREYRKARRVALNVRSWMSEPKPAAALTPASDRNHQTIRQSISFIR